MFTLQGCGVAWVQIVDMVFPSAIRDPYWDAAPIGAVFMGLEPVGIRTDFLA
jgi:hypothetical protein